jgi:ribosomal protein L19
MYQKKSKLFISTIILRQCSLKFAVEHTRMFISSLVHHIYFLKSIE